MLAFQHHKIIHKADTNSKGREENKVIERVKKPMRKLIYGQNKYHTLIIPTLVKIAKYYIKPIYGLTKVH